VPAIPDCKVRTDYDAKELRTLDEIPSGTLRMFLKPDADTSFSGFERVNADRLILMKTDKNGKAAYSFGCKLERKK